MLFKENKKMLQKSEDITSEDRATTLSLQYLEVVERNLSIEYDCQGQPICVHENISPQAIFALKAELRQLLSGVVASAAIVASKEFGQGRVQSVAFGHVSDFDVLAKIGFLFSERIVFWDIISSRVLVGEQFDETSVSVVAEIACNLLLLRPVIELGGAVILPHPLGWSATAANVAGELARVQGVTSAEFGLAMAMAAIDDGLSLHPYTLPVKQQQRITANSGDKAEQIYPEQTKNFAFGAAQLMRAADFAFLQDSKLIDFYSVVASSQELQSELHKLFSRLDGLTPQQSRKELVAIEGELRKLGDARAKALRSYGIDGGVATFALGVTGTQLVHSTAGITLLGMLGVSATAITVTRRWLSKPPKNVIVQAFSAIESSQPFSFEFATEIPNFIDKYTSKFPEDIKEHLEAVTSEFWTEDVHRYLESLPEPVVARVLENLSEPYVYRLVNHRYRQQDYIGDYLAYVWEVSADAFWDQIRVTFSSMQGFLVYDLDDVQEILTLEDMPLSAWATLLRYFPFIYRKVLLQEKNATGFGSHVIVDEYQLEKITEVVRFQLTESKSKAAKQAVFCLWLSKLTAGRRKIADIFLNRLFPEGIPTWLRLV